MSHHHSHEHAQTTHLGFRFLTSVVLSALLVILELIYGIASQSVALISDALHHTGDVFSLLLAWFATVVSRRKRSERYTYGFKNVTILSSFINSAILMVVVGGIGWEAIQRFQNPQPIISKMVMIVAGIAILVKGFSALLFLKGGKRDINLKSIYLDMASDVAVSSAVLISAWLITLTGWLWLDPTASLIICFVIVLGNWQVFRESSNLILQAAPASVEPRAVMAYLTGLANVDSVHDLHIWALSSTETALSAHILVNSPRTHGQLLNEIRTKLHEEFGIGHVTIQFELEGEADNCDSMH